MSKLANQTILLSDLQDLLNNKHKYLTSEMKGHNGVSGDGGSLRGEYNETFKYYSHKGLAEGIFMRVTIHTDSYGSNDSIVAIDFVEGKQKTVTVFEPI